MFAVCQRSLFNASPAESECKGRNFLNNDQMFGRLFFKKSASFFIFKDFKNNKHRN